MYRTGVWDRSQLVGMGVDVHRRNADGEQALFFACTSGEAQIVRSLLGAGADAKTVNAVSWIALWSDCETQAEKEMEGYGIRTDTLMRTRAPTQRETCTREGCLSGRRGGTSR
mmetsp:Transcript_53793/g.105216  ORF Transcript_53793/g.105216 Transcript_53793/m.105216 type:complete len:113 (+) Transcript_53793:1211-1549(+)